MKKTPLRRLSSKRGFDGCGHALGGFDGFGGFDGISGCDGLCGVDGFSGFDGFSFV